MPEFITDRLLLHTGSCYINTSLLVMKLKIESQFISCHACLDIYVISISLFSLLLKEINLSKDWKYVQNKKSLCQMWISLRPVWYRKWQYFTATRVVAMSKSELRDGSSKLIRKWDLSKPRDLCSNINFIKLYML